MSGPTNLKNLKRELRFKMALQFGQVNREAIILISANEGFGRSIFRDSTRWRNEGKQNSALQEGHRDMAAQRMGRLCAVLE
jgi:hypothetical protein